MRVITSLVMKPGILREARNASERVDREGHIQRVRLFGSTPIAAEAGSEFPAQRQHNRL
jgi:hypothetical protein